MSAGVSHVCLLIFVFKWFKKKRIYWLTAAAQWVCATVKMWWLCQWVSWHLKHLKVQAEIWWCQTAWRRGAMIHVLCEHVCVEKKRGKHYLFKKKMKICTAFTSKKKWMLVSVWACLRPSADFQTGSLRSRLSWGWFEPRLRWLWRGHRCGCSLCAAALCQTLSKCAQGKVKSKRASLHAVGVSVLRDTSVCLTGSQVCVCSLSADFSFVVFLFVQSALNQQNQRQQRNTFIPAIYLFKHLLNPALQEEEA